MTNPTGIGDPSFTPQDREAILSAAWLAVAVDEMLTPRERERINEVKCALELPGDVTDDIEDRARRGQLTIDPPERQEARRALMRAMTFVAAADGRIDQGEYNLLLEASRTLPFTGEKILEKAEAGLPEEESLNPVITIDLDLRVTSFNRAASEITGFQPEEMLGKRCPDILDGSLCGIACYMGETRDTGRPIRDFETDLRRKDGGLRRVVLQTDLLRDEGSEASGVVIVLHDITQIRQLQQELRGRYRFHSLIGKSASMQEVYRRVEQVADSNATVLITGESGTGKELVARAIHYQSPRAERPFAVVHCAALAESLLESELFGHVEGAFTGAMSDRLGRFEAADGGTIFLDEMGDVSPLIQVKLLRFLQEHAFERVGSTVTINVDVRLVAATNQDLPSMVREGKFRQDLFYRLKVVPIHLPALRERRTDVPLLVNHFVQRFREETGKRISGITEDAMALLMKYRWPGNIRELENSIEHGFVTAQGERIGRGDLPQEIIESDAGSQVSRSRGLRKASGEDEEAMIRQALEEADGNKARAARLLGIGRATLYRKIAEHGLSQ